MRVKSLKTALIKAGINAYLVTDIKNVYYLTGFKGISDAAVNLLVSLEDDPILIVSQLSLVEANEKAKKCSVRGARFGEKIINVLIEAIRETGASIIHFDSLSLQTYLELVKRLEIKFIHEPELIMALRRVKDEIELSYIRKASEIAATGLKVGVEAIKPGIKEYEVAAAMEYTMRAMGSEGTSFETLVASGPRSAYPHGLATNRVINRGELVTIDLGATYSGYCSDISRTIVVGEPSPKQLRILNLIFRVQEKAFKKFSAGEEARYVDAFARKILENEGYGEYFIHGLGHGVGLSVHESPVLSPNSEDLLEEGNVVTNEPGVYIEGFGGVRIEDMILVRKKRGEKLTIVPYYI